MKVIAASLALIGLWTAGVLLFHFSVGLMMLVVGLAFVVFCIWNNFADKRSPEED
jgi:hypothetical protein